MSDLSPIARKQRLLYPEAHPLAGIRSAARVMRARGVGPSGTLGFLGAVGFLGATASTGQAAVSTAKGASAGASAAGAIAGAVGAGAAAGSVVPIIGTAIGAIVGLVASGIFNKQDQEVGNFDQAVAMWQANRLSVLNIANKYLVLAGLFDLNIKTNIPIYKRYGHMGEQRFVTDMMTLIYNAAQQGQITASDTPSTIMVKVVQPWIDAWGFGAMSDPHADLINLILMGMIADYVGGQQGNWKARSGDYPFGSLPVFKLPSASSASTSTSTTATNTTTSSSAAPVAATQVYSNDGATLTAGQTGLNVVIQDSAGNNYQLGTASGNAAPIYINGTQVAGETVYSVTRKSGIVYVMLTPNSTWIVATPSSTSSASTSSTTSTSSTSSGSTTMAPPVAATQVYSNEGAQITVGATGQNVALADASGNTYQFGTASGGVAPVYLNGNQVSGLNAYSILITGGKAYVKTTSGSSFGDSTAVYTYSGGSWVQVSDPRASSTTTTTSTTVAVPSGYTLIGSANGLQAYQGLDGNYYSWNGTSMSLLTGTLTTTSGQTAYISNGQVSTASLTTASQQAYNSTTAPYYTTTAAPAASTTTTATAGVSGSGLPSWLTWGMIGGAVLMMFALARPANRTPTPSPHP